MTSKLIDLEQARQEVLAKEAERQAEATQHLRRAAELEAAIADEKARLVQVEADRLLAAARVQKGASDGANQSLVEALKTMDFRQIEDAYEVALASWGVLYDENLAAFQAMQQAGRHQTAYKTAQSLPWSNHPNTVIGAYAATLQGREKRFMEGVFFTFTEAAVNISPDYDARALTLKYVQDTMIGDVRYVKN